MTQNSDEAPDDEITVLIPIYTWFAGRWLGLSDETIVRYQMKKDAAERAAQEQANDTQGE